MTITDWITVIGPECVAYQTPHEVFMDAKRGAPPT